MARGITSSYFGKAAHLFVMSEFLIRGWNVAIPEVDQGDDVFVVKHADSALRRVQVKSANAVRMKRTLNVQFSIDTSAIYRSTSYEIYFALVIRTQNAWSHLFIITKTELATFLGEKTISGKKVNLSFRISPERITCRGIDFSQYLNQFRDFPVVERFH